VITKIVTKTIKNTTELNKLKERIEFLEKQIAELLEKNDALSAQLALRGIDAQRVGEQAQRIVTLEHELQTERAALLTAQEQFSAQLVLRGVDAQRVGEQAQRIVTLEHELQTERAALLTAQEQLDDALDAREKDR
jgi:huntingtin-interacting protein 1-related protein